MTYQQTLDYIFAMLPMYSRIGAMAFKENLTNTITLCNALNNPQTTFKSIHVAGTNGKGSTSHMLAAVLQTAGYKTGLYTSPHLKDFRERIKINGEVVSETFVIDFVERIKPLIVNIQPSFFEITVAMAFDYFAKEKVDVAVIEVGLGGRLDSTNIITPILSVITNIGLDHMNMLGNTLAEIAFEKAGIIKKEVPVVIGETLPETKNVFITKANQEKAPLIIATDHIYVTEWQNEPHALNITVANKNNDERVVYTLDLTGIYQTKNILTVLEAIKQLKTNGFIIGQQHVQKGLQHAKKITGLHGRWEVVQQQPLLVLDVGHNEDGIKQIVKQLEITDHENLHIVIGLVKDKEIEKVLSLLPAQATYYFTRAQIPRALPQNELAQKANALGLQGSHYANVNIAVQTALSKAKPKDCILVCGSVFVIGEFNEVYKK